MNATATLAAPAPTHAERTDLNRRAAFFSITVATLLAGLKIWAAASTGSTAMLGSLADTALDLIASLATLAGVWIAAQPSDAHHRFGHGKAEALAALFQVVLISISATALAFQSIVRLIDGSRTGSAGDGILVSVIAILATFALLAYQRHVIHRTASVAISTDHVHYQSDLALNLAVIAALLLDQQLGLAWADPAFALGIAAWLGWGAWRASQTAIEQLMDQEWPLEKRERFLEVLRSHPQLRGVHDLRTRTSGHRDFVQFHVWVDGRMTVTEAHRVMDELEEQVMAEFPGIEVLIHPDPEGLVEAGDAPEDLLDPAVDLEEALAPRVEE